MSEFAYAAQAIIFLVVLVPLATAIFFALFISLNALMLRLDLWIKKRFGK